MVGTHLVLEADDSTHNTRSTLNKDLNVLLIILITGLVMVGIHLVSEAEQSRQLHTLHFINRLLTKVYKF